MWTATRVEAVILDKYCVIEKTQTGRWVISVYNTVNDYSENPSSVLWPQESHSTLAKAKAACYALVNSSVPDLSPTTEETM